MRIRIPKFIQKEKITIQEISWMLYDWANSVYATNIMAAILPIYFTVLAKSNNVDGAVMWGYGSSIATLTVALLAPFLGAVADYKGMKKKLLTLFMIIGVSIMFVIAFIILIVGRRVIKQSEMEGGIH